MIKRNITKITAASMALMMAVSMAGCGSTANNNKTETTTAASGNTSETVSDDSANSVENTTSANVAESTTASDGAAESTTEAANQGEVTEQTVLDETGVDLPIPDGATDATYSVVDELEFKIGQLDFTMDGEQMQLRACTTSETEFGDWDDSLDEVTNILRKGDISGFDVKWENEGDATVKDLAAKYYYSSDGTGYIAWIDPITGILYNLCMPQGATKEKLISYAEKAYVPLQGDAE